MKRIPFLTLVILCFFSFPATAAVIIDEFSTTQIIPKGSSSCITGPDIAGGERDVWLEFNATANVNQTVAGQLYYDHGIGSIGISSNYINIVYDGVDGSTSHNYTGLGHLDLTDGGSCNGFIFNFTQVPSSANINMWITLRQGSDKMSHAWTSVSGTPEALFLPFTEFNDDPWTESVSATSGAEAIALVDFTDIGFIHIEMSIYSSASSFALDSITTDYVIPEPGTVLLLGLGGAALLRKQ